MSATCGKPYKQSAPSLLQPSVTGKLTPETTSPRDLQACVHVECEHNVCLLSCCCCFFFFSSHYRARSGSRSRSRSRSGSGSGSLF